MKIGSYVLRIIRLIFKSKQIIGVLSFTTSKLTNLKNLFISNNKLVDQNPSQIVDQNPFQIVDYCKWYISTLETISFLMKFHPSCYFSFFVENFTLFTNFITFFLNNFMLLVTLIGILIAFAIEFTSTFGFAANFASIFHRVITLGFIAILGLSLDVVFSLDIAFTSLVFLAKVIAMKTLTRAN